jgi:putative colanic acid biosynthesis acetyltransferase WcaF
MINQDTYTGSSFSLNNKLLRVLWNTAYIILFRYSPTPIHRWRSMILRCFGAKIGKGAHVYPKVKIWAPWNLTLGDQSGIGNGAIIYSQGHITIGNSVVISQGVHLCGGTHDYTLSGHPLVTKPIVIGDNVWIAAEAFIHPGVTIGTGAVVGARSVVNKDIPQWVVCAGNPCKILKIRVIKK